MEPVTENPAVGATEMWEFYNTTGDAHPMHVHEMVFEVVNREGLVLDDDDEVVAPIQLDGVITPPEPWETGFKDTVIAYPGQVTRVQAQFNTPGQFVWHCHIVEHEDNEMMRPFRIGPEQDGQPGAALISQSQGAKANRPSLPQQFQKEPTKKELPPNGRPFSSISAVRSLIDDHRTGAESNS